MGSSGNTAMPTSLTWVRDIQMKKKILDALESATRDLRRARSLDAAITQF